VSGKRRRKMLNASSARLDAGPDGNLGSSVLSVKLVLTQPAMLQFNLTTSQYAPDEPRPKHDGTPKALAWAFPFADVVKPGNERDANQVGHYTLCLPPTLEEDLRYRLQSLEGLTLNLLWLNLCRPYGILGALDWEKQIAKALDRPLLRLPDSPIGPTQRPDVLEGAVIVDACAPIDRATLLSMIETICVGLIEQSSREFTHVHVFAAAPAFDCLRRLGNNPKITLHDPALAPTRDEAVKHNTSSPGMPLASTAWVSWIVDGLNGSTLDVVYLVGRSRWTESTAELVLSSSPSTREVQVYNQTLDLDELNLQLNRAGSWATVFVPSTLEYAQSMAFVADTFAQRQAGAVMYHCLKDTVSYNKACKLLFDQQGFEVPKLQDGFIYCHPDFTRKNKSVGAARSFDALVMNEALIERLSYVSPATPATSPPGSVEASAMREQAPGWAIAYQRFLESTAFEELRRHSTDVLASHDLLSNSALLEHSVAEAGSTTLQRTLSEISSVMASYINHGDKES
jgi:hypothetical protein